MAYKKIISEFDKAEERLTNEWEVKIDISTLELIFEAYPDDPDLVMVYTIDQSIANKLLKYQRFNFDFGKHIYEMGTYS